MTVARTVPPELLTYEQYRAEFENEPPTTQPYEILEGVRYIMNTPRWKHQRISKNMILLLTQFEEKAKLGLMLHAPFDIVIRQIPKLQTRQPDLLFISHDLLEKGGGVPEEGPLEAGPELVVEILSPSETRRTIWDKLEDFRSIGVKECWLVSPQAETVEVLRLSPEGIDKVALYGHNEILHSEVFSELTVPLEKIFEE
jgi:Uma2 family endonuclease